MNHENKVSNSNTQGGEIYSIHSCENVQRHTSKVAAVNAFSSTN